MSKAYGPRMGTSKVFGPQPPRELTAPRYLAGDEVSYKTRYMTSLDYGRIVRAYNPDGSNWFYDIQVYRKEKDITSMGVAEINVRYYRPKYTPAEIVEKFKNV